MIKQKYAMKHKLYEQCFIHYFSMQTNDTIFISTYFLKHINLKYFCFIIKINNKSYQSSCFYSSFFIYNSWIKHSYTYFCNRVEWLEICNLGHKIASCATYGHDMLKSTIEERNIRSNQIDEKS